MNTSEIYDEFDEDEIESSEEKEKHIIFDFVIEKGQEPIRIDKYLMSRIAGSTRSKIQEAIDDECVIVNDKIVKQNYKVKPNDHVVTYSFREPPSTEILPENIPLEIVFEDDDILVINKPYNMVVHPGHGNWSGTLVNAVMYYLQEKNPSQKLLPRIGLVHRIDKDTSGLLVVGKTEKAVLALSDQFAKHTVNRLYYALVWGDVAEDEGRIESHIARHERFRKIFATYEEDEGKGKHAVTHYKVIERFNYVTLVQCKLETGRTHQIRVHMKSIGHTLFNDETYGGEKILKGTIYAKYKSFVENCFAICPRQALHAKTLGFIHPATGKQIDFESEMPSDIQAVLEKWRVYVKAKNLMEDRE
jgi:23S rRNA pseudouridine1911/1915/1917 synthase